jgi:putative ABC transport system permease protein
MRYLPLILKNCWRNRRRTSLTIASIGVSMCLLGVLIAMYHAFYMAAPAPDQALRLVVRNRTSITQPIPASYRDVIQRFSGVQEVMVANWFGGIYKDARDPKNQFARFAVNPDELFKIYGEFRIPEDQKLAFLRERTACVIGRDVANDLHLKVGDRLPVKGDIFPGDFEFNVVGVFDSPMASSVMYFNREYLEQSMSERRRGSVGMYYVRIDDPTHSGRIAEAIDGEFHNSTAQTKTESEQAFGVGFLSLLGDVKMFLMVISAAIMFTILLVSANTMAMSVRERVREIGVLKTLGFTPAAVLGLVLGEACTLSMAGGLLGYLISAVLMHTMVAKSPIGGFLPAMPLIEIPVAAVCIVIAAAIGLLSSLIPAAGASRLSIVEALRSTD